MAIGTQTHDRSAEAGRFPSRVKNRETDPTEDVWSASLVVGQSNMIFPCPKSKSSPAW